MHKKNTGMRIASFIAAAMIAPAAWNAAVPVRVSAGEVLGECSFDHKIIPWRLEEQQPAKQQFSLEDGALHILILVSTGADRERWDLKLLHRGLNFRKGHVYKVSFKAKAKRDGMELNSAIMNLKGDEEYFVLDGDEEYAEDGCAMHMGPDMDGHWPLKPATLTTEWQTFEGTFIPTEDIEGAEWSMQYARGTQYSGNAIEGDELWFDEMSIVCTTCEDCNGIQEASYGRVSRTYSGLDDNFISVNQIGYYPQLAKIAVLGDNQGDFVYGAKTISLEGSYDYEIVDTKTEKVVYTGKTGAAKYDADSLDTVCKIDFTEFDKPGEYFIRIKGKEWRSFPFRIADNIYQEAGHDMLTNALNYFYQNRSGMAVEQDYITSGDAKKLAHEDSRKDDTAAVQRVWKNEYLEKDEAQVTYRSSDLTVNGGWYSSADYGKYMTEGGISVWTLQNMYERAAKTDQGKKKFADGSGTMVIPENGNEIPDILDECRYELDFMSKLKVDPDEPVWGKYAGMYYHKVQDHKWVEIATKPWNYIEEWETVRIVKPPTFAATLNYAACAAQAARLWAPYDAKYSAALLQSAKDAYTAYKNNWYETGLNEENNEASLYAPLYQARSGEAYGDTEVGDDAYWAACELYISAKALEDDSAADYLKELSDYKDAFKVSKRVTGGENLPGEGSYTMLNWGNTAAAGSLSLALHQDMLTEKQCKTLTEAICQTADAYLATQTQQGYGVPYMYDAPGYGGYFDWSGFPDYYYVNGYEYGSNGMILNNLLAMAYAYDISGNSKYMNGIATGMDYLLGSNPLSFSYVTGYGSYHERNPRHKFWAGELDSFFPTAPDGVISGGPNAGLQDSYVRSLGLISGKNTPSQRCFADSVEASSVNAAELQWNAPFAWIVSFLQDEAPNAPAAAADEPDAPVWGDASGDGAADVADAVLLAKYISEDASVTLSEQGKTNANLVAGSLDAEDVTAMLMYIAKIIKSEQFPLDALPKV